LHHLLFLITVIIGRSFIHPQDPCEEAKVAVATATLFSKDTVFIMALKTIQHASQLNHKEQAVAFGKDANNNVASSEITTGNTNSGVVPAIDNVFADLHNHPNHLPPDAGDLYGLINLDQKKTLAVPVM
jgi:hypothetical protein